MVKKKLMEGLGQAAVLFDVNEAGYIGGAEATAVQRARIDFGAFCDGLAAEYLHTNPSPASAKSQLRRDVREIEADTDTKEFSADEEALFDRFIGQIDEAIDRLSNKAAWKRTLILWFFRTPNLVKLLIFVAVFTGVVIMLGRVS